jgi:hypothetical protein
MSPLLNLPTELLVEVAEACSSSSIAHLSQTCYYLHDKMVGLVYKS